MFNTQVLPYLPYQFNQKQMITKKDLIITFNGIANEDQIIDSYDMIQKIMIELVGQNDFLYKIDNTLPLINGDPKKVEEIFRNFISNALEHFKSLEGQLQIVHIKDPKSWIFAFVKEVADPVEEFKQNRLVDSISEFTLAIAKKVFKNKEDLSLYMEL